jgi:hypothetical protein
MEAEDQNCMQLQYMIRTVEWERGWAGGCACACACCMVRECRAAFY